jgi:hypothetical protein
MQRQQRQGRGGQDKDEQEAEEGRDTELVETLACYGVGSLARHEAATLLVHRIEIDYFSRRNTRDTANPNNRCSQSHSRGMCRRCMLCERLRAAVDWPRPLPTIERLNGSLCGRSRPPKRNWPLSLRPPIPPPNRSAINRAISHECAIAWQLLVSYPFAEEPSLASCAHVRHQQATFDHRR